MPSTFRCTIVTPEQAIFDDEVSYVSFPAWDGQHGMMPGQSPLLTRLGIGAARIDRPSGESIRFLIDGGFAQVEPHALTLLTEQAIESGKISIEAANAELARANERVTRPGENREQVEHDQQVAMAKRALTAR